MTRKKEKAAVPEEKMPEVTEQTDQDQPEPVQTEAPEKETEEADPIAELQSVIETLENDLKTARNDVARAYADADNTRKRLLREAENTKKYRFQSAALELLPILDSMNLALSAVPESEEAKTFVKGFDMIRSQLENALAKEGVTEIEVLGKPFDSATMQALMQEKKDGVEPGTVTEVLQKGYMLKDRILRPAMVKISE